MENSWPRKTGEADGELALKDGWPCAGRHPSTAVEGLEGLGHGDGTGPRLVGGKSLGSMECWVTDLSIFFIAFRTLGLEEALAEARGTSERNRLRELKLI